MATTTYESLYFSLMEDSHPTTGAIVDFGLDTAHGNEIYKILQKGVRSAEITMDDLQLASCNSSEIRALIKKVTNLDIPVKTVYDALP